MQVKVLSFSKAKLERDIQKFDDFKTQMARIRRGLECIDKLMKDIKEAEEEGK